MSIENDKKYNSSWIKAAKDGGRLIILENDYTKTAEERSVNNVIRQRNPQSRPARYVDGVRLSDDEVANSTQHTVTEPIKKRSNSQKWKRRNAKKQQQLRTSQAEVNNQEGTKSRTSCWIVDPELRDELSDVQE